MTTAPVRNPRVETPAADFLEAVAQAFGAGRARIVVFCDPQVVLTPAQMEPVRAIAGRAIANALAYAYPQDPDGRVWLSLTEARGRVTLSIRDAGVGVPADDATAEERRLFDDLAAQLHGFARMGNRNYGGAEVTVTFPAVGPA